MVIPEDTWDTHPSNHYNTSKTHRSSRYFQINCGFRTSFTTKTGKFLGPPGHHPSTTNRLTSCAVCAATFSGRPLAAAATRPGQSTTSKLGAWCPEFHQWKITKKSGEIWKKNNGKCLKNEHVMGYSKIINGETVQIGLECCEPIVVKSLFGI